MRQLVFLLFFSSLSINAFATQCSGIKLKTGSWLGALQLNDSDVLPFDMHIEKINRDFIFSIQNGEERITLNKPEYRNDTLYIRFPFFDSELVVSTIHKNKLEGEWRNYSKGKDYKIPFYALYGNLERFSTQASNKSYDINGKWQIEFEPGTNSSYPAVGIFNISNTELRGTFLTETGDYRFLAGNVSPDSLYLSCFDGTHAFLFKASIINDTLHGKFFSGNHWNSEWIGFKNNSFQLKDPEKLTYVVEEDSFTFKFNDLEGNQFIYPNNQLANKVIIIQIMGSWCPNCLDETQYFKELYSKYHEQGLEIISIGYETGKTFEEQSESIEKLKNKLDLEFTFLVGGKANKAQASSDFSMLNEVISFPTSIFIGRDGTVRRVHTGFNGPGTGVYYQEYVERTNSLIESLLAE